MRILLFLIVAVLGALGPYHYLVDGAAARADRLRELERLAAQREEVSTLLAVAAPTPTAEQTAHALEAVAALDAGVAGFVDRVLAPTHAPTLDREGLAALGRAAGLDPALVNPIVSSLTDRADGEARRRALAAVLRAIGGSDVQVERLELARAPAPRADVPRLQFLAVDLTLVGTPYAVVTCTERMIAGDAANPAGDLELLEIEATDPTHWDRLGKDPESPPVRAHCRIDLIVGGG